MAIIIPTKTVTTSSLDEAAYFMTFGAKLQTLEDTYPHNVFILLVPTWVIWFSKKIGWVPYAKFCEKRRVIKRRGRKQAGLPAYFTGETRGFKMEEVTTFRTKK